MTVHEAAKILNVPANARPKQIDAAFASLRRVYVTRSQYATVPCERDVAVVALAKAQEAYSVLAKAPPSTPIKPRRARSTPNVTGIPRVSLRPDGPLRHKPGRAAASTATGAARPATPAGGPASRRTPSGPAQPSSCNEKIAAFAISAVIFAIALLLLASTWR